MYFIWIKYSQLKQQLYSSKNANGSRRAQATANEYSLNKSNMNSSYTSNSERIQLHTQLHTQLHAQLHAQLHDTKRPHPYRKADDDTTPPSNIKNGPLSQRRRRHDASVSNKKCVIVWNEKDDDDGRYEFRDASNDYVG